MTAVQHPRPAPVAPRPWSFPRFERSRLRNGVEVLTCHVPDRPVIEARLVLPSAGLRSEPLSDLGIANLVGRALGEGTEERTDEEFADAIESLGAGFGVAPDWEALVPGITAPVARLGAALDLLVEAVTRPRFEEAAVERLVRRSVADYMSARQIPSARLHDEFSRVVFEAGARMAHPGAGVPDTLEKMTAERVRRFWEARFRPVGSTLVVVGDLRGLALDGMLDRTVGAWEHQSPGPEVSGGAEPVEPYGVGRRVVVADFPGAVQTELAIGIAGPPSPVEDRAALRVANHYLGGYFGSRLSAVLREQKAITYGVSSNVEHRGAALVFSFGGAVQADATAEAVEDTFTEIEALSAGRIDESLFRDAVDHLVRTAPITYASTGNIAGALVRLVIERLPDEYLDAVRERIAATTPTAAAAAFARHIRAGDVSVAAAGHAARIAPALEALDIGPVTVVPFG